MPKKVAFGGTVTKYEPPSSLSHTWDFENEQSEVCYELEAVGDKVRLVLTHRRLNSSNEVLSVSGGWHTHLDILEDVLDGRETRRLLEVPRPDRGRVRAPLFLVALLGLAELQCHPVGLADSGQLRAQIFVFAAGHQ